MDSLEEEKESELAEAQEELRAAQEEVLVLQQAAEEAAAERENDIASLQEELCRMRAELQRLHATTQEYELEITSLRAEIRMKSQSGRASKDEGEPLQGDLKQLRDECQSLKCECQTLKDDNKQLLEKLKLLQLQRSGSNDVYLALREEALSGEGEAHLLCRKDAEGGTEDLFEVRKAGSYMTMTEPRTNCKLVDVSIQKNISFDGKPLTPTSMNGGFLEIYSLRDQLKQAEERALKVQKECDSLKGELLELQGRYTSSQKERADLERELQRCREELEKLTGKKMQVRGGLELRLLGKYLWVGGFLHSSRDAHLVICEAVW
ncbi:SLMAP protein, partial [Amia calva]|nr:SLMAP protein [Amia calva]